MAPGRTAAAAARCPRVHAWPGHAAASAAVRGAGHEGMQPPPPAPTDLPGLLLQAHQQGMAVGPCCGAVVKVLHDDGLLAGEPARQDHHHLAGLRGGQRGQRTASWCVPARRHARAGPGWTGAGRAGRDAEGAAFAASSAASASSHTAHLQELHHGGPGNRKGAHGARGGLQDLGLGMQMHLQA